MTNGDSLPSDPDNTSNRHDPPFHRSSESGRATDPSLVTFCTWNVHGAEPSKSSHSWRAISTDRKQSG
jgi:hypothetical protein